MRALMMDTPLLISGLLEHAAAMHGDRELVSWSSQGSPHRSAYAEIAKRVRRLANALRRFGIVPGNRIATLAWSTHRHLEVFYAASGIGAICHTVNPRLPPRQIAWMLDHAEDTMVFVEPAFLAVLEAALAHAQLPRPVVVMADGPHMPRLSPITSHAEMLCYEDMLDGEIDQLDWPALDETAAAVLCYTSGTMGNPKGVLYSHRSQILHAFAVALPDVGGFGEAETVLPAAPMFHVSAWGIPYAAALTGARLVLPGTLLQGAQLAELINREAVTIALGVPTIWVGLIRYLRSSGQRLAAMKRAIIGGAAAPPSLIEALQREFGIEVRHAWGMTELSPLGTIGTLKAKHRDLPAADRSALQAKQGRPVYGVEIKIVDEDGRALPRDGRSIGEIQVRGLWALSGYYRSEPATNAAGWFATGDVGTIDGDGYLQITDRKKDLMKCAGEWISSVEIEGIAMQHEDVLQAAAIGVPDEKWGERPILIVAVRPESLVTCEDILALYTGRVAKWAVPNRIVFSDSLPVGATGKVQKGKLREIYAGASIRV